MDEPTQTLEHAVYTGKGTFKVSEAPFDIPGNLIGKDVLSITKRTVDDLLTELQQQGIVIYADQSTQRVMYKTGTRKSLPLTKKPSQAAKPVAYRLVGDGIEIVLENYNHGSGTTDVDVRTNQPLIGGTVDTDAGIDVTVKFDDRYKAEEILSKLNTALTRFYDGYVDPAIAAMVNSGSADTSSFIALEAANKAILNSSRQGTSATGVVPQNASPAAASKPADNNPAPYL
ncbi:hypothetical protein J4206_03665 [Candidatus Woesearchaeota archaeon]|nr:hypothetical protein [Candidatus Woesearchaeota archaeon]